MAKYVCDFSTVTAIGQELIDSASDMTSATSSYSSTIDSDLSKWEGMAKDSYKTTSDNQIEAANANAAEMESLGNFIKAASQAIEQLEGEIASMEI